ncbi:hypothetical protein BDV26DRAFT_264329 [Aspergillus bertholletiae]|uniref:Uncharacterized protein n=1 Tax=Aspergillus bertholletiae TaxID=1226010 RepID=A0A5N7B4X5_9EURO|nr:hypothetical protein BDV26DRAFT_264329 [Aspergillus bertholletiae]
MKFSKILSVVLATLSVGVSSHPTIVSSDIQHVPEDINSDALEFVGDIEKRAGHEETQVLKQLQKGLGKNKLQPGKSYSFQVTWTEGKPGSTTGTKSPIEREMKQTQQDYGFDHTAIVVGEVLKVEVKTNHFRLDFQGKFYHLFAKLQSSGKNAWYQTGAEGKNWRFMDTEKTVKFLNLKEVSGKWEEKANHAKATGRLSTLFLFREGRLQANRPF